MTMSRRLRFMTTHILAVLLALSAAAPAFASSHREAPLIIADPLVDNTDVYAFRSTEAGRSEFVTLIANFIPFQEPAGGPHFYSFDDTAVYSIKVDNTGDGVEDITFEFRFKNIVRNPDVVRGMATGPITSLTDPDYNVAQSYTVTRVAGGTSAVVVSDGLVPPCNIGSRTTPNYEAALAEPAIVTLANGARYFAGQREEGFYINIEGVFDTFNLPPTENGGTDGTSGFNVHTVAVEVPIQTLTRDGAVPSGPTAANAVIGVWATASRNGIRTFRFGNREYQNGTLNQVSRLGNPLVNELVIPLRLKNEFLSSQPADDAKFAPFILEPLLATLINQTFGLSVPLAPRNDLVAIFATGIPGLNFLSDGSPHEMLRLNVAIPPNGCPSRLGLLGDDMAGFPNGRRVGDDVVDIALRAVAGGTPFTPAFNVEPNNSLGDGVPMNDVEYLNRFPYLATPHPGNIDGASKPHEHHVQR